MAPDASTGSAASTADAVVIGSGAFGSSNAYHLTRRGLTVALVDQHALGSQTSPRAAGLTSKADTMATMARLRRSGMVSATKASGAANSRRRYAGSPVPMRMPRATLSCQTIHTAPPAPR